MSHETASGYVGPMETAELTKWLAHDGKLPWNVADALIRHHGVTVWSVNNSVCADDCMPKKTNIFDLNHKDGLYVSRAAALTQALVFVTQRRNRAEKLMEDIRKELNDG